MTVRPALSNHGRPFPDRAPRASLGLMTADPADPYAPIASYALIGDCHSAALVSTGGSIDWCCMPRTESGSVFGRLLDWEQGGWCEVSPATGNVASFRRYIEDTMVLENTFRDRG